MYLDTVADPEVKIESWPPSSLAIDFVSLRRRNKIETLGNILNCPPPIAESRIGHVMCPLADRMSGSASGRR